MPRSDVITVAELLRSNPGASPYTPPGPRDAARQVRREPWLTRTNRTSAAITFGSVLAVGTTLAVGSALVPHARHAGEATTPASTGPVSDSSAPPARVPGQGQGLARPRATAHMPAQRSAPGPSRGRHAASTPRGPHSDVPGNPIRSVGSSGPGRHRVPAPRAGHVHGRPDADRGLLGGVLDGLSIGPL